MNYCGHHLCVRALLPFIILAGAGAVGDGGGPVKVLPVKTCGVGGASPERDLSAQQTLVSVLI